MERISVGGAAIDAAAIAAEAQYHPSVSPQEALKSAARALVIRALLLNEARSKGVRPAVLNDDEGREITEEEALIECLLASEVKSSKATDENCRRYYNSNRKKFRSSDLFEASHILFAARPDDKAAYAAAIESAKEAISLLHADPNCFESLAAARSACPSGKAGGSLGQVSKGQTVPEFETFLFNMEAGQTCPIPVKTRFGAHVLRLHRKLPGEYLPFDVVKARIAAWMEAAAWQTATIQFVRTLAQGAKVEGMSLDELTPA